MSYQYKTEPHAHQRELFAKTKDLEKYGLLLDCGLGKSKIIIDNIAYLYQERKTDGALIIAPNGVHMNWAINEIPAHMPDRIPRQVAVWDSSKRTKKHERELASLFNGRDELKILLMNIEAFSTKRGPAFATRFLDHFRQAYMAVDESSKIKNHKANRTKSIVKLWRQAKYRRILTGTPVTQAPLDIFPQLYFLDPDVLGFRSFYSFKSYYAVTVRRERMDSKGKTYTYDDVVEYRHMDELKRRIQTCCTRLTKDECLDLPPKITMEIPVKLAPETQRIYNKLKKDFLLEVQGEEIPVPMLLTKLLRLHQITGGFTALEDGTAVPIKGPNAKLQALLEDIDTLSKSEPVIIWAKFRAEIEAISAALRKEYGADSVGMYYGSTPKDERAELIRRFQARELRLFVATQQAAGMGLTLTASSMVYRFSNTFSLEDFLQSNDRNHRIGQTRSVVYKDIVALGTVDRRVVTSLRSKKQMADELTGDADRLAAIVTGD